jgi:hypothetical protein
VLKSDVIKFYKTPSAAARAINVTPGAVSQWDEDKPIPELSARKYHDVTRGKLRFDPRLYERSSAA